MWHRPCRTFHPWCPCIKTRCLFTHWGRVTHTCVSKLINTGSDNGLSPGRCQAIIWTNAGILLIGPLGTNLSEILIKIITFSFKKMRSKVSSGKRRPSCLGLNVLTKPTMQQSKISHNVSLCNRNVHTWGHSCYKVVHYGIWDWCIVGFEMHWLRHCR